MILCFGGVKANAFLEVDNRRKCMVMSVAFTEHGQAALSRDDVWITIAVARTHGLIDQVAGGWSAMLRILLEDLLFGPLGIATAGLALSLPSGVQLVHASLSNILADGDGFRLGYDWRGAASLKPCPTHHNVVAKDGDETDAGKLGLQLLRGTRGPRYPSFVVLRRLAAE